MTNSARPSATRKRIALFLYNMGGPSKNADVSPFLEELFSDNDIIDIPGPSALQSFVAEKITNKRSGPISQKYEEIGGASPQLAITQALADVLKPSIEARDKWASLHFDLVHVGPLMRYTSPRAKDMLELAQSRGVDEIWLLSQYPHCSRATTGTTLRELGLLKAKDPRLANLRIRSFAKYGSHPAFLDLWADRVKATWEQFEATPESRHLIVSAHSLPVTYVAKGDPYRDQILSSAYGVMGRIGLEEGRDWTMAWQSAVGPAKWLAPDTRDVIHDCAKRGKKHVVVWPLAFVSDHIETLHEIDVEFAEIAKECGVSVFSRVPNLNTDPGFAQFLSDLVVDGAADLAERGSTKRLRDLEQSPSGEGCHMQTAGCVCGRYFQAGLKGYGKGLPVARLEPDFRPVPKS